MGKANVMKALALCAGSDGEDDCTKCPYYGVTECNVRLNEDAIALLKANEKPTYGKAIVFTKRDNLSKWFDINGYKYAQGANMEYSDRYQKMRAVYATEREVRLILLVRYEEGKPICRIKCPINPLPIKGEFEAPTVGAVSHTLETMGWTYKEKLPLGLFR